MKSLFTIFIACLIFTSCDESHSGTSANSSSGELKEIQKSYIDSTSTIELEGMDMGSTKVELKWVEFEGGNKGAASKINAAIHDEIIRGVVSVSGGDDESGVEKPNDIQAAASIFIKSYQQINDEIGGEMPWQFSIYLNKEYSSKNILSLHMNTESFTGGAHGYNGNYYLHFDPQTGEKVDIRSFISDTTTLSNLLVKSFRKAHHLKDSDAMSIVGLFDMYDKKLPLPTEISFSTQGLIAIYNPYDIAPFSEGTIVITLNNDEVKQVVKNGVKP